MEGQRGDQKGSKIHHPEFIVVTEEYKESSSGGEYKYQSSATFEPFEKLRDVKPSFIVRFACLFSSMILFAAAFCGVFILLGLCVLVLISLAQVPSLNQFAKNYWSMLRKVFVTALGLFVAVFSPVFGFGIIILYFVLVVGGTNDPIFSKFFESSIYKG